MTLTPVIASYTGEVFAAVKRFLTPEVLDLVAAIARSPSAAAHAPPRLLDELMEMHVLRRVGEAYRLDTAVFLADDIDLILDTVSPLAEGLAGRVMEVGSAFETAPPALVIFLGGILALVQGLGRALRESGVGVNWQAYGGRYARSKVDFDEICDGRAALPPDCLNKTVLPGERYTAVFIGPGGHPFPSLIHPPPGARAPGAYAHHLNRYLVDAYAGLLSAPASAHPALRAAADAAGLYHQGQPQTALVTPAVAAAYSDAVEAVAETAAAYYLLHLPELEALLRATTPGQQGVPEANMMMHLWRYIRRITAERLYARGFFRDSIPQEGSLPVFYQNDIPLIQRLLV